jgi:Icc protein
MRNSDPPVVVVVPGDLHLTEPGLDNHRTALWMVDEVNQLVRPDFVQFIGDNTQHARESEFRLFREIHESLKVPFAVLVGDHDIHEDLHAEKFGMFVGEPYGASSLRGFRFLRLNTLEAQPLGLSEKQIDWFRAQVEDALNGGERVVVFQHHYPFKVWEEFDGPGIEAWREIVQKRCITAIFAGHTHYGQVANDGRNVAIATRSIGDPEGGSPGYTLAYFQGEDLAITYRSVDEQGPIVLITHPREKLLATRPRHVIRGPDHLVVRTWSVLALMSVQGRIDREEPFDLLPLAPGAWGYPLAGDELTKGAHALEVEAVDAEGHRGSQRIDFMVDATGRYTAIPMVRPVVTGTAFC